MNVLSFKTFFCCLDSLSCLRLNLVSSLSSLSSHLSKSRKRGGDFFSTGIHPLLEKYLHPALHNVYQLNNVHTLHWFRCRSCKTKYFPFQAISASRVNRERVIFPAGILPPWEKRLTHNKSKKKFLEFFSFQSI